MVSTIYSGFAQWANRSREERYRSLDTMRYALEERRNRCAETHPMRISEMEVICAENEQLAIADSAGAAILSHYTMGQLCQSISAPQGYLNTLSPGTAAQALNEGLHKFEDRERSILLEHSEQGNVARAITSPQYSRYWDDDVVGDLLDALTVDGWRVPPARPYPGCPQEDTWTATERDILPGAAGFLSIRVGDTCGPAGLYASDRDMFVLLVNQERAIETVSGPMYRALICRNSEVGASSYNVECILYNTICGNHILWSAQSIASIRVVHRGSGQTTRLNGKSYLAAAITAAENAGAAEEEKVISLSTQKKIEEKDVQAVTGLSAQQVKLAKLLAEQNPQDHNGLADTAWGYVQGLTRASQAASYMSERTAIDNAAAKLLRPFAKQVQNVAH
ncbi:MAG: DUF932 domain-containing protein [Opitutae bacterium]